MYDRFHTIGAWVIVSPSWQERVMRFIVVIGMVATANLVSCSSTWGWARMNTYHFQAHTVELEGEKFKVYRHKTDNSLMVSPTPGASQAAPKFVDLLTLDQKLRSTAQRYLENTGRGSCRITKGGAIQGEVYEFWFDCPGWGLPNG